MAFVAIMAHLVPLDFWIDARTQCDALKQLFWLAECDVMEYHKVFDVTYAWEWMRITEEMVKRNLSLQTKRDVLLKYSQYPKGANKLFFTSNHDENSWNGTEYENMVPLQKQWQCSPAHGQAHLYSIAARNYQITNA
jgi:hypothetical protein